MRGSDRGTCRCSSCPSLPSHNGVEAQAERLRHGKRERFGIAHALPVRTSEISARQATYINDWLHFINVRYFLVELIGLICTHSVLAEF